MAFPGRRAPCSTAALSPTTSTSSLNINFAGNAAAGQASSGAGPGGSYGRTNSSGSVGKDTQSTPDRRYSQPDRASPAPPIVVVSPESQGENAAGRGPSYPAGGQQMNHEGAQPPRQTPINRFRQTPKDTIPMIGKPPRKQRSSRFVPSEKVEIERLPPFSGMTQP